MINKYFFIVLCVFLCAACVKKEPVKKATKSYEDRVVVVKDGDYVCSYNVYVEHGSAQWGPEITNLGEGTEGAQLRIRRISDNQASAVITFPSGRVISNKYLRLQKPEEYRTEYTVEPDLMGDSRRPGISIAYNYPPKGEVAVTATIGFAFPTIIVSMDRCVGVNIKPANYKNKKDRQR